MGERPGRGEERKSLVRGGSCRGQSNNDGDSEHTFMIPVEIRRLASAAPKCRNLVLMKDLRKKAWKDRREFEARVGALLKKRIFRDPSCKGLGSMDGQVRAERSGWRK